MSPRLKQLAREAGLLAHNLDGPPTKLEKFAELIVQECAQACINMGNDYEIKSAGQYQAELFAFAIKQHFGIKS